MTAPESSADDGIKASNATTDSYRPGAWEGFARDQLQFRMELLADELERRAAAVAVVAAEGDREAVLEAAWLLGETCERTQRLLATLPGY